MSRTFKNIVDTALDELDFGRARVGTALRIASRGWRRLLRTSDYDVVTRFYDSLRTDPINNTQRYIELPHDYGGYTKVGLAVQNGYGHQVIMTLSKNDRLVGKSMDTLPKDKIPACNCEEPATAEDVLAMLKAGNYGYGSWLTYHNAYRNGQFVAELYGMEGGVSRWGVYRVRENQNRIYFNEGLNVSEDCEIILEYRANNVGPDTKIPDQYEEYLLAYVKYHLMTPRNSRRGDRIDAKAWMDEKEIEAINSAFALTYDEWMDLMDGINNIYG